MQPCPVQYIRTCAGVPSSTPETLAPHTVDNGWEFSFDATDGLLQLSIVVDASEFDWESLYFEKEGVRTGPWDFDWRKDNCPLVPSFRVTIDGRYIGLWFFQRVSIDDMEAKRFRGRMACWLRGDGKHTIKLMPFGPSKTRWVSAVLEPDPEDRLQSLPGNLKPTATSSPYALWREAEYWPEVRKRLADPLARFRCVFEQTLDTIEAREAARGDGQTRGHALPLLAVAYRYTGRDALLPTILNQVDQVLATPAYGNPAPDGYSHNGDFDAAKTLHCLCVVLLSMPDELGAERVRNITERLIQQGDLFLDLMLLNRDYWGGSVIQDHGWISTFTFASLALNLHDKFSEAKRWLRYILPRAERALDAMPRDGFLPSGSYNSPWQHSDPIAIYREARVAILEDDPYDRPEIQAFVDGLWDQLIAVDGQQMLPGLIHEPLPLVAGGLMYAGLARRYNDPRAQWIADQAALTKVDDFYHPYMRNAHYESCIFVPLLSDPLIVPASPSDRADSALLHYEDSGVVLYRDDPHGVQLVTQAGPSSGHHAYNHAQGPCDRMAISPSPGDGHFTLMVGGELLLTTPDSGYRLSSKIRTCMLVDDRGQYGDIGYPMSIPSFAYQGQRIESVRQDDVAPGHVVMQLDPSYPQELGVTHYTREFVTDTDVIVVRDRVVLAQPRTLSWLFQTKKSLGVTWEKNTAVIANTLRITPKPDIALRSSVHASPVVYSYTTTSDSCGFLYARFDTAEPVKEISIEFSLTWPSY